MTNNMVEPPPFARPRLQQSRDNRESKSKSLKKSAVRLLRNDFGSTAHLTSHRTYASHHLLSAHWIELLLIQIDPTSQPAVDAARWIGRWVYCNNWTSIYWKWAPKLNYNVYCTLLYTITIVTIQLVVSKMDMVSAINAAKSQLEADKSKRPSTTTCRNSAIIINPTTAVNNQTAEFNNNHHQRGRQRHYGRGLPPRNRIPCQILLPGTGSCPRSGPST